LEEETSERAMASKEVGADKSTGLSDRPIYRIDIPANRVDLLCPEGLARALKVYLGIIKMPLYKVFNMILMEKVVHGPTTEKLIVKPETGQIRPFVVAAILRDIAFTPNSYANFIELQEKLHANICRKRTLVAIGTHDLDTIQGPFTYEALPPKDIKFTPLNQTKEMNGDELMEFYEADRRMSKFLPIIKESPVFPVIYDKNRQVLSLPPIINSDHSKIKLSTRNVFIECTATDLTKAKNVLNTVVVMFSQYCKDQYTYGQITLILSVEPVEVVGADGKSNIYPSLDYRTVETSADYITGCIGADISPEEITTLLGKMGVSASHKGKDISVSVPPSRSDILHPCDIMEDVAIAYGFNNIKETMPKSNTIATAQPLNKISDALRGECAMAGFTEVVPLILCSHDENFAWMQKVDDGTTAVKLSNPKTIEYQVVRTSLLPGILKTIKENKKASLPLRLFEVSDVVFKDESMERRARNQRNLSAIYCGTSSGFEAIHGLLDRVLAMFEIKNVAVGESGGYYIQESGGLSMQAVNGV
jgi:phenylalanyl-tRNA synthetase beta chain